ncbi:AAA family ATPase [Hydrogenophaga sp.]|uniref:AAA family ATPase n=1 Tax=Hydrogenophaga sp. TaxID=1904254 RepID=UPI003F6C61FF
MISNQPWGFYGRQQELAQLRSILQRQRWFFVQIAGRRRIGKTSLIQQAMSQAGRAKTLYIQIPDSDPAGVLTACNDYLQTFGLTERVAHLQQFAQLIGQLVRQGYVVAIDEFQYFHRRQLFDFCSYLQAEVDKLASQAAPVTGGLIVLGSLHAEMSALLEDRSAPLFNRTTDVLSLDHLDFAALLELLDVHAVIPQPLKQLLQPLY